LTNLSGRLRRRSSTALLKPVTGVPMSTEYVLVQNRRVSGPNVEFQIHDPWTGESTWVNAHDIENDAMPGDYNKVGTIEVPTALPPAPTSTHDASHVQHAPAAGTKPQTKHAGEGPEQPAGRAGLNETTAELLRDPAPPAEVRAIQDEARTLYPDSFEAQQDHVWKVLRSDRLRQGILSRRQARSRGDRDASEVWSPESLEGLGDADLRIHLQQRRDSFDYVNYAAWERLASGSGTVSDARFIVHELSEIGDMQDRGVDYMGPKTFRWQDVRRAPGRCLVGSSSERESLARS
jgi:hypothetical protein